MSTAAEPKPSAKSRLVEELRNYAVISLYLFVCFAVLLVYEASQSPRTDASTLSISMALVKALIIGKFILIGEVLKPGTRIEAPTLLHRVAWRTLGLLLVLIILKLIEEIIVGMVHGQGVSETLAELAQQSWISLAGPILIMLLILVPLVAAVELDRALEGANLKEIFLKRTDA